MPLATGVAPTTLLHLSYIAPATALAAGTLAPQHSFVPRSAAMRGGGSNESLRASAQ